MARASKGHGGCSKRAAASHVHGMRRLSRGSCGADAQLGARAAFCLAGAVGGVDGGGAARAERGNSCLRPCMARRGLHFVPLSHPSPSTSCPTLTSSHHPPHRAPSMSSTRLGVPLRSPGRARLVSATSATSSQTAPSSPLGSAAPAPSRAGSGASAPRTLHALVRARTPDALSAPAGSPSKRILAPSTRVHVLPDKLGQAHIDALRQLVAHLGALNGQLIWQGRGGGQSCRGGGVAYWAAREARTRGVAEPR
jgi:hypothetical protein